MKEFDRRAFLKIALASGVTVGVGVLSPLRGKLNEAVEKVSVMSAGNANVSQEIGQACKGSVRPQECAKNYESSTTNKINSILVTPLVEEVSFRAIPSTIASLLEGRESFIVDSLSGTGGIGMSRAELIVGATSSVLFGAAHNITRRGKDYTINTKTIPASQTLGGMAYWYLQRKFGIVSNTLAHALSNFKALS